MTVSSVNSGPQQVSRSVVVAASATEIFDILANPYRHGELDGSGTVQATASGPSRLTGGAKFSVRMKQYGTPYRITSRVTKFDEGKVIEWQHPLGHRWRWELVSQSPTSTQVTETFDFSSAGSLKAKFYNATGFVKQNGAGIEATLSQLQTQFPDNQ